MSYFDITTYIPITFSVLYGHTLMFTQTYFKLMCILAALKQF